MLQDEVQYDPFVRKLTRPELGVDGLTVDRDLEAAAARGHQLERRHALFQVLEQEGRQTDGLGLVISLRAVFEADLHRWAKDEKADLLERLSTAKKFDDELRRVDLEKISHKTADIPGYM